MKAHTSFVLQRTTEQRQQMEVWRNLQRACWTLNRSFGFGEKRMKQFLVCFGEATKEIAEIEHGNVRNKTWQDQLEYWFSAVVGEYLYSFSPHVEVFLRLCAFTLYKHFGFGTIRLRRFIDGFEGAKVQISSSSTERHKTWTQKLWDWADTYGLNEAVEKGGAE